MSPIRPKDRPGIGERWSGLGSGFRAAVAIPTVKSVPLPLPSAARCWPPPPPQVSLPFPSLPFPFLSLLLPPRVLHACHASASTHGRRRPTESRTYASPTARARSRIGEVLIPEGMVTSIDNVRGLTLAISSSAFIGSSFIIKKIGLKKAGDSGVLEVSHTCMSHYGVTLGEVANFAAYAFAPAVLVTPLGALSIIFSAVLAHFVLKEKLHMFGVVGCILCVVGSVGIVLHAPKEREIDSIDEIWHLATEPGFIVYSCVAVVSVLFLIFWVAERSGHRKMLVYIAICSTMGSLTVISVKAVAIALKLSFGGSNQFIYIQTWFFIVVVILNYLNKALDSFNTAVVSPVYYVMFTILTIFANMIMYKDSFSRNATQIATQLCGFVTIVAGTFLLHKTRDMGNEPPLPDDEICLDGGSVRPDRLSQSSS
uniref:Probable magnesium transporter n=1 Tax=Oryza glumipatula TaxID=40148 RepID=A0A0D9YSK1_9ORYZ